MWDTFFLRGGEDHPPTGPPGGGSGDIAAVDLEEQGGENPAPKIDVESIAPSDALPPEGKVDNDGVSESSEVKELEPDFELPKGWFAFLRSVDSVEKAYEIQPTESAEVRFVQSKLKLHPSWRRTCLRNAMDGPVFDLNKIDPAMVTRLDSTRLQVLLQCLARLEVQVVRKDPNGVLLTGLGKLGGTRPVLGRCGAEILGKSIGKTSKENAAVAFAHKMWAESSTHPIAFAKTFAAAPEAVLKVLTTKTAARVLTAEHLAQIMGEMKNLKLSNRVEPAEEGGKVIPEKRGYSGAEQNALGTLVAKYLEFHAGDSPDQVKSSVDHLLAEVHKSGFTEEPEALGIVCGAFISGMHKHFQRIRENKGKWRMFYTAVTNISWASSAMFGPIGAAVAITMVSLNTCHTISTQMPTYEDLASACKGELTTRWLQFSPWAPPAERGEKLEKVDEEIREASKRAAALEAKLAEIEEKKAFPGAVQQQLDQLERRLLKLRVAKLELRDELKEAEDKTQKAINWVGATIESNRRPREKRGPVAAFQRFRERQGRIQNSDKIRERIAEVDRNATRYEARAKLLASKDSDES